MDWSRVPARIFFFALLAGISVLLATDRRTPSSPDGLVGDALLWFVLLSFIVATFLAVFHGIREVLKNRAAREASNQNDNTQLSRPTWFPILAGVLTGMVVWWALAMLESPSFYRLSVWIFNEQGPKLLFGMPGYYCIHRTLLLAMAGVGGAIGLWYSRWPWTRAIACQIHRRL